MKGNVKVKYRDYGIDILRIIACCFVVCIHVSKSRTEAGGVLLQRVIISSVIGDANALFWAITGCFIFSTGRTFKTIILKYVKSFFGPALACVVIVQIMYGWINSPTIDFHISMLALPNIKEIMLGIIQFDVLHFGECVRHYWYIFEYCKAIMLFPVLELLVRAENRRRLWYVMGLYLVTVSLNELLALFTLDYKIVRFDYFSIPCIEILWGFLTYNYIKKKQLEDKQYSKRMCSLCGVIVIVATIIAVVMAQFRIYSIYGYDTAVNYMEWKRSFAFLMIIGYMMLVLPIGSFLSENKKLVVRVIAVASGFTYPIYLIHGIVIHKLNAIGLSDDIYASMAFMSDQREYLYVIAMTFIVVVLSGMVFSIYLCAKKLIIRIFDYINRVGEKL